MFFKRIQPALPKNPPRMPWWEEISLHLEVVHLKDPFRGYKKRLHAFHMEQAHTASRSIKDFEDNT